MSTVRWAKYARAEQFLPWNATKLIFTSEVKPQWIAESDRFWYLRNARDGKTFILVDPASGTREPAFDHVRLAAALSRAAGTHETHTQLPFDAITFVNDRSAIRFDAAGKTWTCDLTTYECVSGEREETPKTEVRSPDGKWAAFVRDHNLFVREQATGAERQMTTDGEEYNAYAALPGSSLSAITDRVIGRLATPALAWSPDGAKFVTYRLDERQVRDMHLMQSVPTDGSSRPTVHPYRYPLPGDAHVPEAHLVIGDVATGSVTPVATEPLTQTTRTTPFEQRNVWWSDDSARLYVIVQRRGNRSVALVVADAATGETRTVVDEYGPSFVYPHHVPQTNTNVHEVGAGEAVTWFSQRDGWGHLYLYEVATGAMKAQLTSGAWTVRDTPRVDATGGWVYFLAGGREEGRDPYYRHLYRCTLDGSGLTLLTPEEADHSVTFASSGAYFVDTYSRVDLPPVSVLRHADGALVSTLQEADISALVETGWKPPERFTVKARDGVTDLYGVIHRPIDFDPTKKYPVLDSIYPGPQIIMTPKVFAGGDGGRNFWQDEALAQLGFLVVNIDGMGTPFRSKAFVDVAYGANFGEAGGLADHITGLRQLAARDPLFDLERVGIFGHSGGGFASTHAILSFPDFYKVAVSSAGNHNQMGYLASWGERYIGMPEGDNYAGQVNMSLVGNLKGKLLLMHGEMDDNVHPSLTMQMVDALIAANKDFDLLIIPFTNHGFFDMRWGLDAADRYVSLSHPYFVRKRWDYFVRHLIGAEPPAGYAIQPIVGKG